MKALLVETLLVETLLVETLLVETLLMETLPVEALLVDAVLGAASVQDAGRFGWLHHGIPRGGPLVPEAFFAANRAVGNPVEAAAVEVVGRLTLIATARILVAVDGLPRWLQAGEGLIVSSADEGRGSHGRANRPSFAGTRTVTYLAVAGGVDVPIMLGGRGTLATAGLGGYQGRFLRAGDILPAGTAPVGMPRIRARVPLDPSAPIGVLPGPDPDHFAASALTVLLQSAYRVSPLTDRVGMRLDGPVPPRCMQDVALSEPMLRGAIQVPAAGGLLVLGPDHPTTGGYPVIAIVAEADQGALASRPVGSIVRFSCPAFNPPGSPTT